MSSFDRLDEFLHKIGLPGDAALIVSLALLRRLDRSGSQLESILNSDDVRSSLARFVGSMTDSVRETFALLRFPSALDAPANQDLREILRLLLAIAGDETLVPAVDEVIALSIEERGFGSFHTPRDVVRLVSEVLVAGEGESSPARIFDPFCGTGGLLLGALQAVERQRPVSFAGGHDRAPVAVGITRARLLLRYPDQRRHESISVAESFPDDADGGFDYIVANPPFGPRCEVFESVLLRLRPHAHGGGRAVIVTNAAPLFVSGSRDVAIRRRLLEEDLIEAIVELPAGVFAATSISAFVWVLSNRKPPDRRGRFFLVDASRYYRPRRRTAFKAAEMDATHVADIVRSITTGSGSDVWRMRTTEALATPQASIPAPRAVAERESLNRHARQIGDALVRLSDLAEKIVFGRRGGTFEEAPNAIYLPLLGTGRVATSAATLTARTENYVQVVLDGEKARAPYVAGFLDSDRGRQMRQALISGVLPRIRRPAFDALVVILPPLARQLETLNLDTQLTDGISSLTELRTKLWSGELDPAELSVRLPAQREQEFSEFIESLPYPIATILWRYRTARTDADGIDHLVNFFEALAQSYCAILLSIAERDQPWFQRLMSGLNIRQLKTPTFGTWVSLAQRLVPELDRLFKGSDEERRRATLLFGDDPVFARRLLSPKLLELLSEAKNARNERAHGGIRTAETNARALGVLQRLLGTFRATQGATWSSIRFFRPAKCSIKRSLHSYDAVLLSGSRTPFSSVVIQTHVPLQTDEIYVQWPLVEPVLLVPVLRLQSDDGTETCHFFSRIVGEQARFVSYHSTNSPMYDKPDADVIAYVQRIDRLSSEKRKE